MKPNRYKLKCKITFGRENKISKAFGLGVEQCWANSFISRKC